MRIFAAEKNKDIINLLFIIYMNKTKTTPDYLFESSWEVCNKVGGIYTVLSTKAHTLQQIFKDKVIFIGPDIWKTTAAADFKEDEKLFADWKQHAAQNEGLHVKVGRWEVPGEPPVILVDYQPFFAEKDALFYSMWTDFQVDSIRAYGDYDESCIFAYAVGKVIESFYCYYHLENKQVAALFNEWMLGMGELYIRKHVPAIATLFTTHATSIGRSIAGNNKALYAYMDGYNGDQMSRELNMEAKHSVEKQAAHYADCFTTVSDITAAECRQLLDKAPDIVTPNGFEPNFVPEGADYLQKREQARKLLIKVAEKLLGTTISPDALLISTSGRYEYKNKGIDVFIESMKRLSDRVELNREVVAFVVVPAYINGPRQDLLQAIHEGTYCNSWNRVTTHELHDYGSDAVMGALRWFHFNNMKDDKVKVIFVPSYIDLRDPIFNCSYYDLLIGFDLTVFPSYYEPWGYTPLESVAFHIPTITTSLSGFGQWAKEYSDNIDEGVEVVKRSDYNTYEVVTKIADTVLHYAAMNAKTVAAARKAAAGVAEKALWKHFMPFYNQAYTIALLNNAEKNKH